MKTYELSIQKQSNEDIFGKDFIGEDDTIYQADPHAAAKEAAGPVKTLEVDACGLQCPGPVLKLKTEMDSLKPGEMIRETATDPGFAKDVYAWAKMTGNSVVSVEQSGPRVIATIKKGGAPVPAQMGGGPQKGTSLILFSDDLDKALATMVIANGAISTGKQVTVFFTFWGLSFLKKHKKPSGVKKDFMGRMFGMMLPSHSGKLALSKMNMGGMGSWMMKKTHEGSGRGQCGRDAGTGHEKRYSTCGLPDVHGRDGRQGRRVDGRR